MQFLMYDPNFDPNSPDNKPPTPEMMAEMGQFVAEAYAANKIIATGALADHGKRLRLDKGNYTVTDGPFIELKELLAGFAVIQADTLEEAIEWAKRFRKIVGDGETEIVRLYGQEDFAGH